MSCYMYQGAYTIEAWNGLLNHPGNRFEAIRPVVEELGGMIVGGWFTFGEYDFMLIVQLPDSVSAAAFALAMAAGGALKSGKTTPLLTVQEAMGAMKKASMLQYAPPQQQPEPRPTAGQVV